MAEEIDPIEAALQKRDQADYEAYLLVKRILDFTDYTPGKKQFMEIYKEFHGDSDLNDAVEFMGDMNRVVENRDNANDEFLQAVSKANLKPIKS